MRKSIKSELPANIDVRFAEKGDFSIKKVLIVLLVLLILTGSMGVWASNEKVKTVNIKLSSGYEMNVMTTKEKVSDILSENNIVVLEDETVLPELEQEINNNKSITISKKSNDEKVEEVIQKSFSKDEILKSYTTIVEKHITIQEEIPYETVTKDVSSQGTETQDRVIQVGENGLKEVVYSVKYQNNVEIEKTVLSETIIKDPIDKIVEVRTKQVTSRSSTTRSTTWNGTVLSRSRGSIYGPSGKETYYNLNMNVIVNIMRRLGYSESAYPYWVRDDGVKMLGNYVMVAANFGIRPRGSTIETSLGTGLVVDTGGFASRNPTQLDIAVTW